MRCVSDVAPFEVGDIITPHGGTYAGNRGRIVTRRLVEVDLNGFYRREHMYGVDFEHGPNGRGFVVYFRNNEIERTS